MPQLFGGRQTRSSSHTTAGRAPGHGGRTLFDLLQNAATGQLLSPPYTPPTTPTRQGIGGLQAILPQLLGQAFGPNRGVAGLLSGGGVTPSLSTPTDAELGISAPTSAPPGFLPPTADVQANLPHVRRPTERVGEEKLRRRADRGNQQAAKKLAKRERAPKYLS